MFKESESLFVDHPIRGSARSRFLVGASRVRFTKHAVEKFEMLRHYGEPLFLEILKASKIVPLLVEGLAKKEVTVA